MIVHLGDSGRIFSLQSPEAGQLAEQQFVKLYKGVDDENIPDDSLTETKTKEEENPRYVKEKIVPKETLTSKRPLAKSSVVKRKLPAPPPEDEDEEEDTGEEEVEEDEGEEEEEEGRLL